MTLGTSIKLIRTARGLSQRELASKLDVSPNYISLIEKDNREPSISFLRKLSTELGVPVSLFFMWQEAPENSSKEIKELRELVTKIESLAVREQVKKKRGKKRAA